MGVTTARQNELLDELAANHAAAGRLFAARIRMLAELADLAGAEQDQSGMEQFVSMELAGSCKQSRLGAGAALGEAVRYQDTLPRTVGLLAAGRLYVHQARVVLEVTESCTPDVARAVEARLLPAGVELAPPDLRRAARRAVLAVESEVDSQAVLDRLASARAKRRVGVRAEQDGMATIRILAPAEQAQRWVSDLDQLVAAEKAADRDAGIWRSADQIRVDLLLAMPGAQLADLQQTGALRRPPAADTTIVIHVPVATVLGVADAPGELEGHGPISAEHIRLLLPDARLEPILVDQRTGQPLRTQPLRGHHPSALRSPGDSEAGSPQGGPARARGLRAEDGDLRQRIAALLQTARLHPDTAEPQHDPSRRLRRYVQLRDLHCRGVGCSTPARRCHLDHHLAYPAGPTSAANLQALSASCHRAKHTGWQVVAHPDTSTTWTSPLGRRYHRPPPHQPPPPLRRTARPPLRLAPRLTASPGNDEHGDDEPLRIESRHGQASPAPPAAGPDRAGPGTTSWPDEPPF